MQMHIGQQTVLVLYTVQYLWTKDTIDSLKWTQTFSLAPEILAYKTLSSGRCHFPIGEGERERASPPSTFNSPSGGCIILKSKIWNRPFPKTIKKQAQNRLLTISERLLFEKSENKIKDQRN